MAYTNKLDTDIITVRFTAGTFTPTYDSSAGTIEMNAVIAYYTFIGPDGVATSYTALVISGAPLIVDETYATIDTLLNP